VRLGERRCYAAVVRVWIPTDKREHLQVVLRRLSSRLDNYIEYITDLQRALDSVRDGAAHSVSESARPKRSSSNP
jgi:hypothetical protein